ncbi:MAG: hypothetical protein B6D55_00555 [Candidatus Omnitrophica bacterium 4484_70.2]|nr:MAG: hypothetical protein B6D55_00555 [Candidatus Omnitrophica bacterium 4484_70.2]
MSKKLILFVAALMFIFLGNAYSAVENIKVSGDLTTYAGSRYGFDLGAGGDEADASFLATIARLKFDADLTEDVSATLRLITDKVWGQTVSNATSDVDIDLAYVTLKNFFNYPLTLKIGKQEIKIGSGVIVGDPTTNQLASGDSNLPATLGDLDLRKAFDAVVAVVDYSPWTITLGYIKDTEGDDLAANDDVNVYAVDLGYNFEDYNTQAELYYVLKDAKKSDVGNIGVRVVGSPRENLTVSGEVIYQYDKPDARSDKKHRSDLAALVAASYTFADQAWKPTVGVDYAYFSENWDPMYEDITPANIVNNILPNTDVQLIGLTVTAQPQEDVLLKLRYANLRLVEEISSLSNAWLPSTLTTYSINSDKKDLGDEVDFSIVYNYTEDVQLGLNLDYFNPGKVFNGVNDDDAFQALGSLKVTF